MDKYKYELADENMRSFIYKFDAIGTQWEIETYKSLDNHLLERLHKRIEQFDITYSRFRSDSLISQIASSPKGGRFDFPNDSVALFDLYDRLYTVTEGALDPLVGRELELMGYDQEYSFIPKLNVEQIIGLRQKRTRWSKEIMRDGALLVTRRPLVIDVGAAGKGYLVDIVSDILKESGFTKFIVDGGGDLIHFGDSEVRIGLEHPFNSNLVIGVANLKNSAICASAVNKRAWGNELHHVINANTGDPVQNVVATWVIANDAMTADGLATALFFKSGNDLAKMFRFSFVRMFADGRAEYSQNFDGEIFT